MLSNNQRKQIVLLAQKKHREQQRLFVAEGEKIVMELLQAGFTSTSLFSCTVFPEIDTVLIDLPTMKKITHLKNPSPILGVFQYPEVRIAPSEDPIIALDSIRDPGNLGTIIRLCDWFGLSQLVCSESTVDCFNPKVIQASMGSIARVNCQYVNLESYLSQSEKKVYGAALGGSSLYKESLETNSIMIFGNESHGISEHLFPLIDKNIAIPRFRKGSVPESLNVATATSIFLSELFRTNNTAV